MQNRKTIVSIILKTLIAVLALIAFFSEYSTYQASAPRLYGYWVMLVAAIFYFASAIYLFFHRHAPDSRSCLPRLTALITLNLLTLLVGATIFHVNNIEFPTAGGFSGTLLCYIVPILATVDWLYFARKGALRLADPWNFLAPIIIFASLIIITADSMPAAASLRYPYAFLDYASVGLLNMGWLLLIAVTLIIIAGYTMVALDFVLSGELAKHVVLPKVKTIVVVEAPRPDIIIDSPATKPKKRGLQKATIINDVTKVTPKTKDKTPAKRQDVTAEQQDQKKKNKLANVGKLQPINLDHKTPDANAKNITKNTTKSKSKNSSSQQQNNDTKISSKSSRSNQPSTKKTSSKPQTSNTKKTQIANENKQQPKQQDNKPKKDEFKIPTPPDSASKHHDSKETQKTAKQKTQNTKQDEFKVPTSNKDMKQAVTETSKTPETIKTNEATKNTKAPEGNTKELAKDSPKPAKQSKIRHF